LSDGLVDGGDDEAESARHPWCLRFERELLCVGETGRESRAGCCLVEDFDRAGGVGREAVVGGGQRAERLA
jgi:hypothetical protein